MLKFNIKPIFELRGIDKPYSFMVNNGFSGRTTNMIINNKVKVLRLEHIERLCLLLLCEPNDFLEWKPDKDKIYSEKNPLNGLRRTENIKNISETFSEMTFQELKDLAKTLQK